MFYVFHGDDRHSQKETLAELIGRLGDPAMLELNTTRFTGVMPFAHLRQACDAVPFLAKRRIAIVEDLTAANPSQAFMDQLLDYLPHMPASARLFFLETHTLPANHPLLKAAEEAENGYVRLFTRPEGNALNRWVQQRVTEKGGRIAPRAVHLLVTNAGNDLALLDNELEKLVLYKGSDALIGGDDVELLCPFAAEASIFDLVDAIGNRNGKLAALLLQQKLQEGADPFYLFAMFMRQFRLLIQVKEVAETGARPVEVAKKLKMHNFVAGKLMQQAQGFSLEQLEQIYAHLLAIDVGVKTGRADMTTALNLLVAALT